MSTLPVPGTRRGLWGFDLVAWLLVSHTEEGAIRPEVIGGITAGLAPQTALDSLSGVVDTKAGITYVDEGLLAKADATELSAMDMALNAFITATGLALGVIDSTILPLAEPGADGQVLMVDDGEVAWETLTIPEPTEPPVTSVNTQDGDVVLDADDIDDTSTTHKFATSAQLSKLSGIESGADVTDATNVAAAGAVMNSGTQSIAGVKTFSSQPVVPTPTTNTAAANKVYVDGMGWHPVAIVQAGQTAVASSTGTVTLAEATVTLLAGVQYLVTMRGSCNAEGASGALATAVLTVSSSTMAGSPSYTTPAQVWEQGVDTTHVAEASFLVTGDGSATTCALWSVVSTGTLGRKFSRLVVTAMPYGRA